jgi:hypothetical protein
MITNIRPLNCVWEYDDDWQDEIMKSSQHAYEEVFELQNAALKFRSCHCFGW